MHRTLVVGAGASPVGLAAARRGGSTKDAGLLYPAMKGGERYR